MQFSYQIQGSESLEETRASLLLRIRDRANTSAWREFDAIYRPLLFRYARACGCNSSECEDVVQFCMVAIHRQIDLFEYDPQRGRFKSWLRTLVGNRVRSIWRKRREDQARSGEFERVQQREDAPDEAFDKIWIDEHLRHCLSRIRTQMDERSCDAFQRYVIENESVPSVCEEFGLSANALYKIKWRIMHRLRSEVSRILGDQDSL